jgi:hypothetical protein
MVRVPFAAQNPTGTTFGIPGPVTSAQKDVDACEKKVLMLFTLY